MESVGEYSQAKRVRNYSPTDVADLHGCWVRNYSPTDVTDSHGCGCVIILPRMSQIFTDVGACERTRIARITRMQHKKKSVTIREICGTTF